LAIIYLSRMWVGEAHSLAAAISAGTTWATYGLVAIAVDDGGELLSHRGVLRMLPGGVPPSLWSR
jgi:hypothetical protein